MTLTLDDGRSELTVWTYKDGLLARLAHDLALAATGFSATAEVEGDLVRVEVRAPVAGLRVRGQVKRGEVVPLGDKEHRDIADNVKGPRVLDGARHPEVLYRGEGRRAGDRVRLEGALTLRGASRPLAVEGRWQAAGGEVTASGEVELRPSEWGIEPFTALMGALKVQDRVRVSWTLRYRDEGANA